MNEKMIPVLRALYACPFSAIGCPSKVVAIDAGVPGILSKIAEISPPETEPTYKAIRIDIPSTADRPYVTGKNSAIAMTEVSPGTAPKIIPTPTPTINSRIILGANIAAIPCTNNVNMDFPPSPKFLWVEPE
jgi:hypothetical protein